MKTTAVMQWGWHTYSGQRYLNPFESNNLFLLMISCAHSLHYGMVIMTYTKTAPSWFLLLVKVVQVA